MGKTWGSTPKEKQERVTPAATLRARDQRTNSEKATKAARAALRNGGKG